MRCRVIAPPVERDGNHILTVSVLDGPRAGETLVATCPAKYARLLKTGDCCLLRFYRSGPVVVEPLREGVLLVLVVLLAAVIAATMGRRGLRVIASIAGALLLVGFVLVPLAVRGVPPLATTAAIVVPICLGGALLIGGWNRKSVNAAAGALAALVAAAALPVIACRMLAFTGLDVEFGTFFHLDVPLWYSPGVAKVNFHHLMLAGMIIASLGATMDVSMVVATAARELRQSDPGCPRREILKAGLGVGRDVLGMMVLAIMLLYAGSEIEMLLLHHLQGLPQAPGLLLNYEEIAMELVCMASTALAFALAVPATALIAAMERKMKR